VRQGQLLRVFDVAEDRGGVTLFKGFDMSEDNVGECRSCEAAIVWTITASGKKMPCDVAPSEEGEFFLFRVGNDIESENIKSQSDRCTRAHDRGQKRHACHFATCPNADQHRKG